jgi:hypothetical protein
MNWFRIVGIVLIVVAVYGMLNVLTDFLSGKLEFWPFGAEIGAGLTIWLGIFMIKRGNRHKNKFQ